MSHKGETAYITGGASGIARSLAANLVSKGMKIFIADWNHEGAQQVASELNAGVDGEACWAAQVDVSSWESQRKGFETAVQKLGRIDYVFPIAGISEVPWLPKDLASRTGPFEKPNLKVLEINAYGALYSAALAIAQFRRQEPNKKGYRGKICSVSSACGFYYIHPLPIYTAAKHAIVGFTRAFGSHLPTEKITLNTICPTIVATGISTGDFYKKAGDRGLLITLDALLEAFEFVMDSDVSGQAIEILPGNGGHKVKEEPDFTDQKCKESIDLVRSKEHRSWALHEPVDAS